MSRCNRIAGFLAGAGIVLLVIAAAHGEEKPQGQPPSQPTTAPGKTGKERLGDKASDEQRVDNCKVPRERRGSKTRPDDCR